MIVEELNFFSQTVIDYHQLPSTRVVKGIFVSRERPFYFSVKCEIAIFSLVNRDYVNGRET